MVGSKIIDWVMGMMTKGEVVRETVTRRQAYFGAVKSGFSFCPAYLQREVGKEFPPSLSSDPAASRRFCLDDVWGSVCTMQ